MSRTPPTSPDSPSKYYAMPIIDMQADYIQHNYRQYDYRQHNYIQANYMQTDYNHIYDQIDTYIELKLHNNAKTNNR